MSLYLVRYGVMSWIPSFLVQSKGFSPSFAKWLVGIFELATVPGVIIMGAISDFLKDRRAIVCIACVILLFICLTTYFFSTSHALIVTVLFIIGTLIYAPLTLVGLMVNEAVPKLSLIHIFGITHMNLGDYLVYTLAPTLALNLVYFVILYWPIPVSYTHLDVYKRQRLESKGLRKMRFK